MPTSLNLSTLTPEELSNFFIEGLKEELGVYNLQASKVGLLGYLTNMLANITYDNKVYKDFLFNEAFPATAQVNDNIYLHGTIYGYKNQLATPANANGTISFDFSLLVAPSPNVKKRIVTFGVGDPQIQILIDDVVFTSSSIYKFIQDGISYYTVIQNSDGSSVTYPSNSPYLTVPMTNFKQESIETVEFTLPNYNYASYYTYNFQVSQEYISRIVVYIKMPEDDDNRTIANMNVDGMPWFVRGEDRPKTGDEAEPETLTKQQMRMYRWAALKAGLLVAAIFGGVFALFLAFCDFIWFR